MRLFTRETRPWRPTGCTRGLRVGVVSRRARAQNSVLFRAADVSEYGRAIDAWARSRPYPRPSDQGCPDPERAVRCRLRIRGFDLPLRQGIPAGVELEAAHSGAQQVIELNTRQHVRRRRGQFDRRLERFRSREIVVRPAEDRRFEGDGDPSRIRCPASSWYQPFGAETWVPLVSPRGSAGPVQALRQH